MFTTGWLRAAILALTLLAALSVPASARAAAAQAPSHAPDDGLQVQVAGGDPVAIDGTASSGDVVVNENSVTQATNRVAGTVVVDDTTVRFDLLAIPLLPLFGTVDVTVDGTALRRFYVLGSVTTPDSDTVDGTGFSFASTGVHTLHFTLTDGIRGPGDHIERFVDQGRERFALVHVPEQAGPLPMLVWIHGIIMPVFTQDLYADADAHADAHGYIVAMPQGIDFQWQFSQSQQTPVDDIAFMNVLLDHLEARYDVDTRRIYESGMSNGGYFSYALACTMADRFAAFMPVAGRMAKEPCATERPIPIAIMHGTEDWLVPYGPETETRWDEPGAARIWAERNGCATTTTDETLPDIEGDPSTTVIVHRYDGCPEGAPVVLYEMQGVGHYWPGSLPYLPEPILGYQTWDVVANDAVWDFVSAYTLPD